MPFLDSIARLVSVSSQLHGRRRVMGYSPVVLTLLSNVQQTISFGTCMLPMHVEMILYVFLVFVDPQKSMPVGRHGSVTLYKNAAARPSFFCRSALMLLGKYWFQTKTCKDFSLHA